MFLSMNWICDYVDLDGLDKMQLISKFSLSTAEVENDIAIKGRDLEGVVVAEIMKVFPHPSSTKLHLLEVDDGRGERSKVVCGAPNVREGMKTAFAPVGAKVGGVCIAPQKISGVLSEGMCCSEAELGISDDNGGIMDIDDDIRNGTSIKSVYDIDDIVFEVDNKSLTNRPDLWGHYGIAREFAALTGRSLRRIEGHDLAQYSALPRVDMEIEDELCYRYACIKVGRITRKTSPVNMRIRLFYCGMRAINFLADITNYIMLEMGQPMHAFDARKVNRIRIKRMPHSFEFQTLDKEVRVVDGDTLMICNGDQPVAIAGIMGGLDSEIVGDTSELCLESACFDPVSIRKSTVRLSHRTDASMRYEKSLDPEMVDVAIGRFLHLLFQNDPKVRVTSSLTDSYVFHYPKISFDFNREFVDRYTGIHIDDQTILNTLQSLGFDTSLKDGTFFVTVPSWRATKDVTIKADIVEEITRIYGYDNFEVHTASSPLYPVQISEEKKVEEQIKDLLVKRFSLHEVHSYIWPYYDECRELGIEVENNIGIVNSNVVLRNSMEPTQLCQVSSNLSYASEFGIFEIGRVVDGVDPQTNLVNEYKKLCITLYSKNASVEQLYWKLGNMLAVLVDDIKHKAIRFENTKVQHAWQHPKNLNEIVCAGTRLGTMGMPYPAIVEKIDKKSAIVYAEIDVKKLAMVASNGIVYEEPSKYPEVEADLTFLADSYKPIGDAIDGIKSPIIRKVSLANIYDDEQGRALTVHIVFSNQERTLTHEEVNGLLQDIVGEVKKNGISLKAPLDG